MEIHIHYGKFIYHLKQIKYPAWKRESNEYCSTFDFVISELKHS